MLTKEAYAYYAAGVAVAAVRLKLTLRQVSINPARGVTDVISPRDAAKDRITMWLTGLAAEKKGVGETDPFRRMRNRQRIRAELTNHPSRGKGKGAKMGQSVINQAQDRANALCVSMFPAIKRVAENLLEKEMLAGDEVGRLINGETDRLGEAIGAAKM